MTPHTKVWRPLHEAIAWALTQDEDFCVEIADDNKAQTSPFWASHLLEQAMMHSGCFDALEEAIPLDPPSRTIVVLRHRVKPGYVGRFKSLAEVYESGGKTTFTATIKDLPHAPEAAAGIVSVGDFLLGRWHDAFRSIVGRIADGDILARGVAIDGDRRLPSGDLPAASVTTAMMMDLDGTVWEGPPAFRGEQPRRWIGITINWNDLLKCFEPVPSAEPSRLTVAAETLCREWLIKQMEASPNQTDTAKTEWYRQACEKFSGLGTPENATPSRSFVRAWTAAIGVTDAKWDLSGRKKSKR